MEKWLRTSITTDRIWWIMANTSAMVSAGHYVFPVALQSTAVLENFKFKDVLLSDFVRKMYFWKVNNYQMTV